MLRQVLSQTLVCEKDRIEKSPTEILMLGVLAISSCLLFCLQSARRRVPRGEQGGEVLSEAANR
jgi:hypothetical protein